MKFSKRKFSNLSERRQVKKIYDFIREIEDVWQDEKKRNILLKDFSDCLSFSTIPTVNSVSGLVVLGMSYRDFVEIITPLERLHKADLHDGDIPGMRVEKGDGRREKLPKIPVYMILDNLRSSFNVGSIFRTAECFGISEILLCGYTPLPDSSKVLATSMGTAELVKWQHFKKTEEAIKYLRNLDCSIYAVETGENACLLGDMVFAGKCGFIMGNEALGISEDILSLADEVVKIDLHGWKNSLNVGVATAIVCYEVRKRLE